MPTDDGNYQADTKGIISVVDHTAQLVQGKPLMLVTDLDDTLVCVCVVCVCVVCVCVYVG